METHTLGLFFGFPVEVHESLASAIKKTRIGADRRTIGKTRKARKATDLISPFVRTKFGEIHVDALLLYESQQHGPHTSYHVLSRIPLTGEPKSEGVEGA